MNSYLQRVEWWERQKEINIKLLLDRRIFLSCKSFVDYYSLAVQWQIRCYTFQKPVEGIDCFPYTEMVNLGGVDVLIMVQMWYNEYLHLNI